jgi:hypothetical protein
MPALSRNLSRIISKRIELKSGVDHQDQDTEAQKATQDALRASQRKWWKHR